MTDLKKKITVSFPLYSKDKHCLLWFYSYTGTDIVKITTVSFGFTVTQALIITGRRLTVPPRTHTHTHTHQSLTYYISFTSLMFLHSTATASLMFFQ